MQLRSRFNDVTQRNYVAEKNYLTFDFHALDVIDMIGNSARSLGMDPDHQIRASTYEVRCLKETTSPQRVVSEIVGTGAVILYLRNHHNIHFEPLFRVKSQ